MKTYVLTVIGASRVTLSVEGADAPFWTLDFAGTLTSVGAAKEAIRFLQNRGEALTKRGLELTGFRATELVWTYRIVTEPLAQVVAV